MRNRMILGPMIAAIAICMPGLSVITGSANQPAPVGPRAIALGNAFTGIADDASAAFWNPAGLPWIGHQEIALMHADLFGTGVKENNVTFVLPIFPSLALAADGTHTGIDDGELNFGDTRFDIAGGFMIHKKLSLGLGLKYLARNTGYDGVSIRQGNALGLDVGVLAAPMDRLTVGLALHDAFDTRMRYTEGNGTSLLYERRLTVGAAYRPLSNGLISCDVDDRLHLGVEFSPVSLIALRAGLEKDLHITGEDPTYSVGMGARAGIVGFDYALSLHPELGETNYFGVSLAFNFNPARVRIEKVEAKDVYASLQKSYAEAPFGTARLRNLQDTPLTARLSVYSPEIMDQPTDREIVLRPGAVQELPLTAVLSDKIMSKQEDSRVSLTVLVSYTSYRLPRTERRAANLIAYAPGALSWTDGVDQAAAFVTQKDPLVMRLSRESCRSIAGQESAGFRIRNLGFAAAIVDALGLLGVTYLPDPNTPFQTSSLSEKTLDTVHYPRETLAQRAGDCDDTSVLVAALLESVGVPTCFVDVPGHLFVLAGTGVHERNALSLAVDKKLYVIYEHEVWIPIETTALGKGFAEAWLQGAETYNSWASRGAPIIVRVDRAQGRYAPAGPPQDDSLLAFAVDPETLSRRVAADAAVVTSWQSEYMAARYGTVRYDLETTPAALDEIAQVYYLAGQTSEAQAMLEMAISKDPASPRYRNNLANTHAARGDLTGAIEYYSAALAADSTDAGIWLNLGLVEHVSGDSTRGDVALVQALERSGGFEDAVRLLGLTGSDQGLRGESPKLSAAAARDLLRRAVRKVPQGVTQSDSTGSKSNDRTVAPANIRVASARAADVLSLGLGGILYWKH